MAMAGDDQAVSKLPMTTDIERTVRPALRPLDATIRYRIRSAVWGGALAALLMITTALPWNSGVFYSGTPNTYLTLWQLNEGTTGHRLSSLAGLMLVLLAATVGLTLAAAAEATGGIAVGAGIMGLVAAGAEILFWWQVEVWNTATTGAGAGPVHAETGLHVALVLSIGIAAIYLPVGIRRLRTKGGS